MPAAGPWQTLRTLSSGVTDVRTREALRAIEEAIKALQKRVEDAERRLLDLDGGGA